MRNIALMGLPIGFSNAYPYEVSLEYLESPSLRASLERNIRTIVAMLRCVVSRALEQAPPGCFNSNALLVRQHPSLSLSLPPKPPNPHLLTCSNMNGLGWGAGRGGKTQH